MLFMRATLSALTWGPGRQVFAAKMDMSIVFKDSKCKKKIHINMRRSSRVSCKSPPVLTNPKNTYLTISSLDHNPSSSKNNMKLFLAVLALGALAMAAPLASVESVPRGKLKEL